MSRKTFFISGAIIAFAFSLTVISQNTQLTLKFFNVKKNNLYSNNNLNGSSLRNIKVVTKSNNVCKNPYLTTINFKDNLFNPLTASNKKLISHGYPAKSKNESNDKAWRKAVSVKLIKPNLVSIPLDGHGSVIDNNK